MKRRFFQILILFAILLPAIFAPRILDYTAAIEAREDDAIFSAVLIYSKKLCKIDEKANVPKLTQPSPQIVDYWGERVQIGSLQKNDILLSSSGPDKKFNTKDDVAVSFNCVTNRLSRVKSSEYLDSF